jgi:hypothetical protein
MLDSCFRFISVCLWVAVVFAASVVGMTIYVVLT